jgi:hypothetical protein
MRLAAALAALLTITTAPLARAQPVATQSPLAGLTFLIGNWSSGRGQVADTCAASS